MTTSLDEAIIRSWQLTGAEFSGFVHEILGPLLLDHGLLAPWRYLSLSLELEDKPFGPDQHRVAFDISNNAQSLLAELIALGDQTSLKDQLRILGLLCILISSGSEIPATTTRQIIVSRDALDLFSLSCINSRSHELAKLVFSAVDSADNSSRGLDAFVYYLSILESPLIHRHRIISKELRLDITPWTEMTEVVVGLRKCAELLHDRKHSEAEPLIQALIQKYPNCPEIQWFANTLALYLPHPPRWRQQLDPLAYYHADQFSTSGLNIVQHVLSQPRLIECCDQILSSYNCGFDPSVSTHASSCLINQFYQAGKYTDAMSLIERNSDDIIRRSSYDPFELALFSSQLGELELLQPAKQCDLGLDGSIDIVFVVGLPHPCWFEIERKLSEVPTIGTLMSNAVVDHIGQRLGEVHKENNPVKINQTSSEEIAGLRKFYLQNLSFVHGGKSVDFILDLIPNSFKHVGILSVIFPESKFLILNFSVEDLILGYLTTINGFNSRHATATMGELVAYVLDYAHIIHKWSSLLGERLSCLPLSHSSSSEFIADSILTFLNSGKLSHLDSACVESEKILRDFPSLSNELLEYKDDLSEINHLLLGIS